MRDRAIRVRVGDLNGAAKDDKRKTQDAEEESPRRVLLRFLAFANHAIDNYSGKWRFRRGQDELTGGQLPGVALL